jgi:PD-(D/E)XK nuclease superfamily
MKRIQLHASALALFSRCGEAFRRRYVEGQIKPPANYIIVGRATDTAVSADLVNKIKHNKLLGAREIDDIAAGVVERNYRDEVDMRGESMTKGTARELAINRAKNFASFAHRNLNPTIHPKAVQRAWSIRLDGFLRRRGLKGLLIDYVGTLDIEEWLFDFSHLEPDPAHTAIRDLKTSMRSPQKDAADAKHDIQLTSYALGKLTEDAVMPERVQVDYLVDHKHGIEHKPVFGMKNDFDLAALFNRIEITARSLKAGIFVPAPRDHWCCTEKWCGYWHTCPYVKNKRTLDLKVPDQKLYRIGPTPKERTSNGEYEQIEAPEPEINGSDGIHLVERGQELDSTDD